MNYLLDTNAALALLTNRPAAVRERLRRVSSTELPLVVPSIVLYELWYGVARSHRIKENTERLRSFLAGDVVIAPFDEDAAAIAGDLRADLERAGTPIGPYDLLIAAQALRSKATLVTANVREFERVRGLAWEDWTVA